MEMGIRNLARVPFFLYNCKVLSNFAVTLCINSPNRSGYPEGSLILKKCNTYQKNIKKFHSTGDQVPTLPVLKEIKDIANGKEALQILGEIAHEVKLNPSAIDIITTQQFTVLCNVILNDIRSIPTNELVNLLKYVTRLQIPTDTMLVQNILQMLRATVNNLSIHQLPFLYFLLQQQKETPLVSALRTAVPLAFKNHLESQNITGSLKNAKENLRFACYCRNKNLIDICLKCIKNLIYDASDTITAKDGVSVYHSLSFVEPYTSACTELLLTLEHMIIRNIAELSEDDVHLLMKIVHRHRFDKCQPNNEHFIDVLCNAVIQKSANFAICISFIQMLTDMKRNSIPLIDYVAGMSFIHRHLQKATLSEILCFLWALITVDYKPVFWDDIKKIILEKSIRDCCSYYMQLRFAVALTALDCYYPELIEEVFTTDTAHLELESHTEQMQLLLELYQGVKTLYPIYEGAFPHHDTIEYIKSLSTNNEEIPLKTPLAVALGGPQYLRTKLKTKLGHIIDYVVVMGSNGQPIAIADNAGCQSSEFIEDMETPSDSQTILIFNFPEEAYSNNISRLNSRWQLKLNSVEALTGHNTLAINSRQWAKLPDFEKVPYLGQAIRLKCDNYMVHKN